LAKNISDLAEQNLLAKIVQSPINDEI